MKLVWGFSFALVFVVSGVLAGFEVFGVLGLGLVWLGLVDCRVAARHAWSKTLTCIRK